MEPIDGDTRHRRVTFLWRGSDETRRVTVIGGLPSANLAKPMRRFGDTDLWYLTHGDLGPDHVLYDEQAGAIRGVIDFGDMAIGDPAWDLVFIYEDYGLDFLKRLLEGFPDVDRHALLRRVYWFWELDVIDWALRCRVAGSEADFAEAIAQLTDLRVQREQRYDELMRVCMAA